MSEPKTKAPPPSRRKAGPWVMPPPWLPPEWEPPDLRAVQQVWAGTASPEQQQRAMRWIAFTLADKDGMGWHPQDAHLADFAAGRRWVGRELTKALMINVAVITGNRENA